MPKISVIVPCYNVAPYVGTCLDSLVNQTLRDIEIICVDDWKQYLFSKIHSTTRPGVVPTAYSTHFNPTAFVFAVPGIVIVRRWRLPFYDIIVWRQVRDFAAFRKCGATGCFAIMNAQGVVRGVNRDFTRRTGKCFVFGGWATSELYLSWHNKSFVS